MCDPNCTYIFSLYNLLKQFDCGNEREYILAIWIKATKAIADHKAKADKYIYYNYEWPIEIKD